MQSFFRMTDEEYDEMMDYHETLWNLMFNLLKPTPDEVYQKVLEDTKGEHLKLNTININKLRDDLDYALTCMGEHYFDA